MQYDFAIDFVTKKQIVVFDCTAGVFFPKNGFALAKDIHQTYSNVYWDYYQGNNVWLYNGWKTTLVYDTKEEAQLACTQHLNFLKECGYAP